MYDLTVGGPKYRLAPMVTGVLCHGHNYVREELGMGWIKSKSELGNLLTEMELDLELSCRTVHKPGQRHIKNQCVHNATLMM